MTCKDNCIHYEVCKGHYNENDYVGIPDAFDLFCKPEYCGRFFKNKADFVEVKHGEWIENDYRHFDGFETVVYPNEALKCSECNHNFKKELLWCKNYCPNCGVDMRKEGADNGDI